MLQNDAGGRARHCIQSWMLDPGKWLVGKSFCNHIKKSCWRIRSPVWWGVVVIEVVRISWILDIVRRICL